LFSEAKLNSLIINFILTLDLNNQAPLHEDVLGSEGTVPSINIGDRWRWVVSFTPQPLYPWGTDPRYPLNRRLSGPHSRSGHGEEKTSQPRRKSNPNCPARSLVAIPTEPSRLLLLGVGSETKQHHP